MNGRDINLGRCLGWRALRLGFGGGCRAGILVSKENTHNYRYQLNRKRDFAPELTILCKIKTMLQIHKRSVLIKYYFMQSFIKRLNQNVSNSHILVLNFQVAIYSLKMSRLGAICK